MKRNELYKYLLGMIDEIPDEKSISFESQIVGEYSIKKLQNLLTDWAYTKPDEEVTAESVQILCQFLADRWKLIKGTNEEYNIETRSKANIACLLMAEYLEETLKLITQQLLTSLEPEALLKTKLVS